MTRTPTPGSDGPGYAAAGGPDERASRASALALTALLGVLLMVRGTIANSPGLWIDEGFSLAHARGSFAQLWTEGWRLESSPPLYYSLLRAWTGLVGQSEVAARLLSVLLTGVSALFVHRAARVLAGPIAAGVAVLTWMLPALAFEYSIEIRPYALLMVFVAGSVFALARVLVAHRERRIGTASAALRAVAPVVLAGTAAFYTHTTAFACLVGLAAAALYHGWRTRAGAGFFAVWLGGCGALALLCAPHVVVALGVLDSNRAGLAWIPSSFDPRHLLLVGRHLVLGQIYWNTLLLTLLAAAVYVGLAVLAWRCRARTEVIAIGVVLPVVGFLALWVAGMSQPILMARTVLWLWVPLAVLVGCAAADLDWRRPVPRAAAVAAVLLAAATTVGYLEDRPHQRPWHAALVALEARIQPGDGVLLLDSEVGCVLDRYAGPALRAAPRARLHLGRFQRFWSGQRLNLGCNDLPLVGASAIGHLNGSADWVLTGDERQRNDLARLLEHERGRLEVVDRIVIGRYPAATRIVDLSRQPPGSSPR